MYWKHNNPTSPQIEAVLNKEDVTLYDLMDEEDILQECKTQNKKLIDFLVRPDVMEELVTLTTVEPSSELDERARYKYPNIACELLTSDVPVLNERLASNPELLGKLYCFLESEAPLNSLLASYFSKTLSNLITQRSEQDWYSYQVSCLQVLEFLKSKKNFVKLLVKHLGTSAIMDLMLKFITNIEGVEIKQNILNWLDSEHIVECLVNLLRPEVDGERQSNAAQLLSDIIAQSRDNTQNTNERSNPDPIIGTLESREIVTLLLDNILGPNKTENSIVGGIQVLLALLNFNKTHPTVDVNYEQMEVAAEREHREKVIENVNTAIIGRLKDFHDILLNPPNKAPIRTTVGVLNPPLGNTRLQVTKLIAELLHVGSTDVKQELAQLGSVNVLLDLFFHYTLNNFLHTQVQNCIAHALATNNKIQESDLMYEYIFVHCRLLTRILEAWNDNEQKQAQPKGVRKGYMGHLISIANNIVDQWDKTMLGEYVTEKISAETVELWKTFINGPLADVNKKQKIVLGGVHPNSSMADDNQDAYNDIPFPSDSTMEVTYNDYAQWRNSAQPSSNYQYIDVHRENESEEKFEAACAAKGFSAGDLWNSDSQSMTVYNQNRRSSSEDEDDPLDLGNANPWKNDEENNSPPENTIGLPTLADSDPWSATTNPNSGGMDENWANFDSFSTFESEFNGVTSNSFCAPFAAGGDNLFASASTAPLPPPDLVANLTATEPLPPSIGDGETKEDNNADVNFNSNATPTGSVDDVSVISNSLVENTLIVANEIIAKVQQLEIVPTSEIEANSSDMEMTATAATAVGDDIATCPDESSSSNASV